MTAAGRWRATYAPGDWLALCGPTSLVVIEPPGAGWTVLATELWQEVVRSASMTDLAARLAGYGLDTMPSFGALFWTPAGMRSLVRGSVRLVDPATDRLVATAEGVQTWVEVGLKELTSVRIDTADRREDDHELRLPLVVGAVRVSSIVLDAGADAVPDSPQTESTWPEQVPPEQAGPEQSPRERLVSAPLEETTEAMSDADLEGATTPTELEPTVSLTDLERAGTRLTTVAPTQLPAAPGTPAPLPGEPGDGVVATVLAAVCPHGHANPPGSRRCTDCGVRIVDPQPRRVAQPSLATLRVTDGTQVQLDRVVLVGRAPSERGEALARLLTVPSPAQDISRTHLEIAPDGWRVLVKDLHSTNGTVLVAPDGASRRLLPPGEAVPVPLGSVLELAEGVAVLLDLPQ